MKTILKILSKLFWLVFYIIIFTIISPILKLPINGLPKTYVVLTGSMNPIIKSGSVAITTPVDPASLTEGDIIAFASPDNPKDTIIHRIKSIKSQYPLRFSTKGDANDSTDNWDVVDVGVLGKHLFSIPYLGYVASLIKTPLGFTLAIVTPALLSILSQIINIKKTIKEEIDKQVKQKTPPPSGNIFPLVFIFTFISSFVISKKIIYAVYLDTVTISGLSITMANFDVETTPPMTQITTNQYLQTDSTFPIDYTITEDNPSHVDLCTSFNLQDWDCIDRGLDNPINFTPSLGNGVYCFITIGTDLYGNIEPKNLPQPALLNPLDSTNYCTAFQVNLPQ